MTDKPIPESDHVLDEFNKQCDALEAKLGGKLYTESDLLAREALLLREAAQIARTHYSEHGIMCDREEIATRILSLRPDLNAALAERDAEKRKCEADNAALKKYLDWALQWLTQSPMRHPPFISKEFTEWSKYLAEARALLL